MYLIQEHGDKRDKISRTIRKITRIINKMVVAVIIEKGDLSRSEIFCALFHDSCNERKVDNTFDGFYIRTCT